MVQTMLLQGHFIKLVIILPDEERIMWSKRTKSAPDVCGRNGMGSTQAMLQQALVLQCYLAYLQSLLHCTCMYDKSLRSCLTLHDPKGCSLPGSSVLGILQARGGLPCHHPGDLPKPGIEPASLSPALAGWFFTASARWEAITTLQGKLNLLYITLPQLTSFMVYLRNRAICNPSSVQQ